MAAVLTRSGSTPGSAGSSTRRLLVINSNASAAVTEQLADTAAAYLGSGTTADFTNPDHGPEGIDCALDDAVAAVETARLVVRHRNEYDAFVLACGADPGLHVARQLTDRPVVGLAQAGMLTACQLGLTFGIPTFTVGSIGRMRMLARLYGLEGQLGSVFAVGSSSKGAARDPELMLRQITAAGRAELERNPFDVLVLTGSVLGRLAGPLSDALGVPAVSGLRAAIQSAELLVNAGLRTSRTSVYMTPPKDDAMPGYPEFREFYEQTAPSEES